MHTHKEAYIHYYYADTHSHTYIINHTYNYVCTRPVVVVAFGAVVVTTGYIYRVNASGPPLYTYSCTRLNKYARIDT